MPSTTLLLNWQVEMIQNLFAKTCLRDRASQGLDLNAERHQIAQLINKALQRENLGQWTDSSLKGDNTLVFYFVVNDEIQGIATILAAFEEYYHRAFFQDLQIRKL